MLKKRYKVSRIDIAAPCPMNWDGMTGDNRARFCELCSLHVYNISDMTRKEVNALIAKTEGRICARLFKRADGTIITKDCPVGVRAIRRRVVRTVGAVATAILTISMSVIGKTSHDNSRSEQAGVGIPGRSPLGIYSQSRGEISGRILDPNGAPAPQAKVILTNQDQGQQSTVTADNDGRFQFSMLDAGLYTIEVDFPGFSKYQRSDINLGVGDTYHEDIVLDVGGIVGVVVVLEPKITDTKMGTKTVFKEKQIQSLPF